MKRGFKKLLFIRRITIKYSYRKEMNMGMNGLIIADNLANATMMKAKPKDNNQCGID